MQSLKENEEDNRGLSGETRSSRWAPTNIEVTSNFQPCKCGHPRRRRPVRVDGCHPRASEAEAAPVAVRRALVRRGRNLGHDLILRGRGRALGQDLVRR